MSQKTPKDEFDYPLFDGDEMDLDFPGSEPDGLTEEERLFSFDDDYLTPDADRRAPSREDWDDVQQEQSDQQPSAEETEAQERAVLQALKKLTRSRRAKSSASDDAGTPDTAEPERREKKRTLVPTGARLRQGLARRDRKTPPPQPTEKAPPTIGRTLRSDEMLVYDSELDDIDYTDEEDLPEARDYMPIRFRRYGRAGIGGGLLYALFVISVSIVLACVAWMFASDVLALNKEEKSAVVTLDEYEPTGDMPTVNDEGDEIQVDIDQVADALKNAGIIEYKWLFKLFAQISHAEVKMDPGTYDVSTQLDYRALVSTMQFGSDSQEVTRVTFPEGYSMEQIFTLLEENDICKKSELYEAAANYGFDYDFLDDLELGDATRLEGYLFPDTYDFYQGESASVVINRFLSNMESKLPDDIESRAAEQGLSVHEAIIVASLIEKEAGSDDERAIMASVIYNRLNSGWKLQLDSTINYIQNTSTFNLTYADLETDSPYNTYMYEGLPVGPICNPGLASIEAALDPASTDYWYWYSYETEDGWVTEFFTNSDDFDAFAAEHPYE